MLKVAVVDRSPEVRRALGHLLLQVPGVRLVGSVADGRVALDLVDSTRPDVLVLDAELDSGVYALLRRIVRQHPQTRIVALTNQGDSSELRAAFMRAGAGALFDKAMEFELARDWIAERARESEQS